jgi:signal transduction histidine kinase
MKTLYRPLQLYIVIVVLYAALMGWWVYFLSTEGEWLVRDMAQAGAELSPAEAETLKAVTKRTGRMFLFESLFLGLLMVGSVWLVLRSLRRETLLAQQQRNFLSAVTHELRSPIASAKLYIESLQLGRADAEKTERYLRHAREDLQRLAAIVEDLLVSRRLQEARADVRPEALELRAQVGPQLERLAERHAERGARLLLHAEAPVAALADAAALETIVENLVSNGVKYGGERPLVELSLRADGDRALLEVRDHGRGLQGADARRIFEPFVRGGDELVRTQQGVGLGLYIVRELVAAQGGRVSAEDAEGGGLRVTVSLPLAHAAAGGGAGTGGGARADATARADIGAGSGAAGRSAS